MTTVSLLKQNGRFFGFSSQGHSGRAEAGEDVVCAAVSEAVRFAGNLLEAFGHKVEVKAGEKKAEINLSVKRPDAVSESVFGTFLSEMRLIEEEYPKNVVIHILEV